MKKNLNQRAKNLLNVVEKIETWCKENINDTDTKVFSLVKVWNPFVWYAWLYSTTYQKIFFVRGDQSRWGITFENVKTGMTQKDFDHYIYNSDDNVDYSISHDGVNLNFDAEIIKLKNSWNGAKEEIDRFLEEEWSLESFEA